MNSQKLTVLAIVSVGMVIWAVALSNRSSKSSHDTVPTNLIQGLDTEQIGSIEISGGDDKVVLVRQGNQFVAKDKSNYPASAKQVSDLITKCYDIKTTELYSTSAKNHEDLGVTLEKARTVIEFKKADGTSITGVVIGESGGEGISGNFVRRTDSNDVYVTPSAPYFQTGITSYLDQEIFSLEKANIASVTVTDPNNLSYTLVTDVNDNNTILMSNLPRGRTLAKTTAQSVMTALTSLRFDDVSRTADPNAKFDWTYIAKMKDARVYTIKTAITEDSKSYIQVSADYTDQVTIDPTKQDDPNELRVKEAKLKTQEQALLFTTKHKGWIYTIPDWKSQYLVKFQDELLEPLPEPEPTEEVSMDPNDINVLEAAPSDLQEAIQGIGGTDQGIGG
jgi:hypothetical protein